MKIPSGGWQGAGFAQAVCPLEGANVGRVAQQNTRDTLTLGKATQCSGERDFFRIGPRGGPGTLGKSRPWRKGCQSSPGRGMGRCPDTSCSLAITGRPQRLFTGTIFSWELGLQPLKS